MNWRYYYIDDLSRAIYYSDTDVGEERPDLIFLGMSANPNPKIAVAIFTQLDPIKRGYRIRSLV